MKFQKRLIILLFFVISMVTLGAENYISGKIIEEVEREETRDDPISQTQVTYKIEVKDGENKGAVIDVIHYLFRDKATTVEVGVGDKVVLYEENSGYDYTYNIITRDRRGLLYFIISLFILLTIFLGKRKGVRAVAALIITLLLTFFFFIPNVTRGLSPILLALVVASLSLTITIYFMVGFSYKGHVAIIGSLGGMIIAAMISLAFVEYSGMSGYIDVDMINNSSYLEHIKMDELISAAVILGSIGAVMDIAMSISSALHELELSNINLTRKDIFKSGMNIGRDIIGTMVNTLVLAYVGGTLFSLILLESQVESFPLIRVLNDEAIIVDILRAICGSIGILVTVPLTAYLSSIYHVRSLKPSNFQTEKINDEH